MFFCFSDLRFNNNNIVFFIYVCLHKISQNCNNPGFLDDTLKYYWKALQILSQSESLELLY